MNETILALGGLAVLVICFSCTLRPRKRTLWVIDLKSPTDAPPEAQPADVLRFEVQRVWRR